MAVRVGLWRKSKNWWFWTVVLEKTLESPLNCKEIQPVNPKGNQSWIFIGRTDAEAETPILWSPDVKTWLIWKDPDAGKDWRQEEKGTTEDEMVGWHRWLDGRESEWTPGVGDGQGGLACCGSWGRRESDTTEQRNWTDWMNRFITSTKTLIAILPSLVWIIYSPFKAEILFWFRPYRIIRIVNWKRNHNIFYSVNLGSWYMYIYIDTDVYEYICINVYFTNHVGSIAVAWTWTLDSAREKHLPYMSISSADCFH